ncbi:MAG TPA: PAS domain-containing sensor histidine kinase [Streptosporangiaceae bacterium]|nr:PAS domain-containing sensor histidine kinase [Streptosporangiaceae bacterium]
MRGQAAVRVVGMPSAVSAPDRIPPGADPSVSADSRDFASELVLADDLPDGLVVADRVGKVAVFNRAAARLTGVSQGAALGQDVRQVLPLRDSDDRCWWTLCQPYTGLSTRTRHPERPLYLPDGTELLVSVGYVRAPRGCGPREGWSREPGAVKRIAITLRSTEQRMRLERSRADLVSTVAHELRSPLTSVKGFTATLLAKWPRFTDDQKKVMLETVNADADRVTRLITELLDVSRIESGRIEVHRELVDIASRAMKIISGRIAAGDTPDRYQVEVAPGVPETWLDVDKVDQVLANLIENAVRHGAGTVTTVVEPAVVAGAPGVAVAVRDQGPGIAPEVAPRVFARFWRAKRRGGAGLGLFIVKGLVEAHGGEIIVQQAPGGGAEFRFTMPAGTPEFG